MGIDIWAGADVADPETGIGLASVRPVERRRLRRGY
jgi:hypothetical protein